MRSLLVGLALSAAPWSLHAQSADLLRGTVRSDSARAIVGATVMVTRSSDRVTRQATTDSLGRWRIELADSVGDYLVFVSAPGFQSARRRVQRTAGDLVVDFALAAVVPQQLRAVQVAAQAPPRPGRGLPPRGNEETGASEKWVEGVAGSLAPTQRGDINAIAGTVAGLTTGPGGASLLGASAASNLTTLNGTALPGGVLPRAANLDARFVGATFDPTRGGFAGGQFDLRLAAGDRFFQQRRAFLTLEPSALQRTDLLGRAQGLNASTVRASVGADGELIREALTYNVALDVSQSASSPSSLLSADATALQRAGIAPDSIRRLTTIAPQAGVPLSAGDGLPRSQSVTWLGRLDDTRDTSRVLALTSLVGWGRDMRQGLDVRTAPSAVIDRGTLSGALQLLHQRYVGKERTIYNENRGGISGVRTTADPTVTTPSALLVLGGATSEASSDVTTVSLAGASGFLRNTTAWTAEGTSEWAWLARGNRHRFRAIAWGRGDGLSSQGRTNAFGSYRFNSLSDVAANRPASYARTVNEPSQSGTAWNGAVALAHRWVPTQRFQALYGLRLEGGLLQEAPALNSAAQQALGVRTDRAPLRLALSPRAGFTWRPLPNRPVTTGSTQNELGSFLTPSTNIIRGGIGLFRDLYAPGVLTTVRANTGLPGSAVSIFCVGAAAPTPNWGAYGTAEAIPSSCRDNTGPLAQSTPSVLAFGSTYDVARSWRATLNWSGAIGIWQLRAEGVAARNVGLTSSVDRNFANQPRFTLGNDGRPVYVPVSSIDPATGAVSWAASRRTAAFGSVRELTHDLASRGEQLTLVVTPDILRTQGRFINASYTVQRVQQQYRGFDGASAGDPTVISWARGSADARHVLLFQVGSNIPKIGTFTLFLRSQSGRPFTPLVDGDLDGDGTGGDRAYVAALTGTRSDEAELRSSMAALLDAAPPSTRHCLTRQAGRIADRQSCEGPWTHAMNARVDVRLPSRLLGRRTNLALNFANPLGGLDQLLHGSNLRGWGTVADPDPVLLIPRSFDAATQRFQYRVNPRFGDTRPARTLFRTPFRVSLDFSFDLTRDEAQQDLERSLDPMKVQGTWRRPTPESILRRYVGRISSVHSVLLFNADTLFLTRSQIEAFAKADTTFRQDARAIYAALADSLAALPERFDAAAAVAMVARADVAYDALFWKQREIVIAQLTSVQSGALPDWIRSMLVERLDPDPARRPRYRFPANGSSVSVSRRS